MATPQNPAKSLFLNALEITGEEERQAYVDECCAGNDLLRQELLALLAHHQQIDSFLDSSPAEFVPTMSIGSPPESPATGIGPYKLIEQIGEGGMGTVWMAQQSAPVRRTVALKLIKAGMDSRQIITRFEAERQALAMMDHPNIAKVLDAGTTENGRPYFVMELVKGAPITSYCDEQHLTPKERLELFVPVCQAIQHAHQKGVIHRDLKPSNVLVSLYDGRPVPKVIDFGVAKAVGQPLTEKTLVTGIGNLVGTLEYMSPEQAEVNQIDIDTRSDIYSLGVLLYELLTGSTPFSRDTLQQAGMLEMLRLIREQEPSRPSTKLSTAEGLPTLAANRSTEPAKLTRLVRGELDWIVMKALEKDRNRRYETANGFAMDVQRYLADEPVTACPPSPMYRLTKLMRRNRGLVAAISAVVMALSIGLIASAIGFYQADQQREFAEANETRARIEAVKATAIVEFLQEMLRSANPESSSGTDYTVRQLLDDTAAKLDSGRLAAEPEVESTIRLTIGAAYCRLEEFDKAEPHLARAVSLRKSLYGEEHEAFAEALLGLADNEWQQSRLGNAGRNAVRAVAIYDQRGVTGRSLIQGLRLLQRVAALEGHHEQVQSLAERALAEADRMDCEVPELPVLIHTCASSLDIQGKYAEAETQARRAVEMHERVNGPSHPETGWGRLQLGRSLMGLNRLEEAEAEARQALAIFRTHYSSHNKGTQRAIANLRNVLARRGDQHGLDQLDADLQNEASGAEEQEAVNAELQSVHRDRRQIVHATREPVTAVPAVSLPAERMAFVLLSTDGAELSRFDTLVDATQNAGDGHTIEIRGNGPFISPPITITNALSIRAAAGFRPVIERDANESSNSFIRAEASLVLEGLEFRWMNEPRNEWCFLLSAVKDLHAANCRFLTRRVAVQVDALRCPYRVKLRNCEFLAPTTFARANGDSDLTMAVFLQAQRKIALENCISLCKLFMSRRWGYANGAELRLTQCTLHTPFDAFQFNIRPGLGGEEGFASEDWTTKAVQVDAAGNVICSDGILMFAQEGVMASLPPGEAENLLARVVGWRGERNAYACEGTLLRLKRALPERAMPPPLIADGLAGWNPLWRTAEEESIESPIGFRGGDLLAKADSALEQLTPEDFRLSVDSAGYGAGPDGKDLGADVDLVGPGAAYERWKQTPEYQLWLRETGQMN